MPFSFYSPPTLSPEQVNPFNAALKQAFQTYGHGVQAAYARQNLAQALLKQKAETDKINFLIKNPQYINPQAALISMALQNQGSSGGIGGGGVGQRDQSPYQGPSETQEQPAQDYSGGASSRSPGQDLGSENRDDKYASWVSLYGNKKPMPENWQPNEQEKKILSGSDIGTPVPEVGTAFTPEMARQQQEAAQQSSVNTQKYDSNAMAFNPPELSSPLKNKMLDPLWYSMIGMDPIKKAQLELAQSKTEKYLTIMNKKNEELDNQANFANQSSIDSNKFLDALNKVTNLEIGPIGGKGPALTDAKQNMQAASSAMASSATSLFKAGGAIHDSDIALQKLLKPSEFQNRNVAFDLAHGVIAKNDRIKEQQQFYATGSQLGIKPEILDAQWNKYETERPYINPETKTPNDAFKGTWKDYLSPEAINSFVTGKHYIPRNQKALEGMNWTADNLKQIKKWALRNGHDPELVTKKGLYDGAKDEGMSLAQLKAEFSKMGAFGNG